MKRFLLIFIVLAAGCQHSSTQRWQTGFPKERGLYVVYSSDTYPYMRTAYYDPGIGGPEGWGLIHPGWKREITHWMPMPKKPDVPLTGRHRGLHGKLFD